MAFFYLVIALLIAGIALISGIINLYNGLLHDGERSELLFGILALCVFAFLITPPVGFILKNEPPYPVTLITKRLFIWSFYILLPWFIEAYSGYRKRAWNYAIAVLAVLSFSLMTLAETEAGKDLWAYTALVTFGLNLAYGITASLRQQSDGLAGARWLLSAMIIYGIFYLAAAVNYMGHNWLGTMMGITTFFPFHLHLVAFLMIMSARLRSINHEQYRLEKVFRRRDIQWSNVVHQLQLLTIELDPDGLVRYANPYAVKVLGCQSEADLIGKDWFGHFLPAEDVTLRRALFQESVRTAQALPHFTGKIIARGGRHRYIDWTTVFLYRNHSRIDGTLSIGIDITEQEKAFEQVQSLKNQLEKENLLLKGEQVADNSGHEGIIGKSEAILYAIQKAKLVASTSAAVLLEGETGVGKELFANFIHKNSYRSNEPFIEVNCAALPAELMESELFGHEKGSFTGAIQSRRGRFELANGGTIFLDEIGELPLHLQPKLLRVLQSGEFERIGSQQTIKVDVRVISATNRNLLSEVKAHQFREDLYYRLNVFPITIPPLRKRKEDIPLLISHFIAKITAAHQKKIDNISKADLIRLTEYPWYGNVRELANVLERSIITSNGRILRLDWLDDNLPRDMTPHTGLHIEEIEREHILMVLKACDWKINGPDGAATKLGLNPSTLRSRLKKLNIMRTTPPQSQG